MAELRRSYLVLAISYDPDVEDAPEHWYWAAGVDIAPDRAHLPIHEGERIARTDRGRYLHAGCAS